jgi:signal transduction histidine kinase
MRMNPLKSVGAQLSLALALVVAAALAIVYVALVPTLQRRLVDAKLNQLQGVARTLPLQWSSNPLPVDDFVAATADSASSRALIFAPLSLAPLTLTVVADSQPGKNAANLLDDSVALRAMQPSRVVVTGTVERNRQRYAEAAVRLDDEGNVLLLTESLRGTLADVQLVRQRLLFAGLIALLASIAVGFGAAAVFARRIKRLERAADRIAGGDFSQAVVDPASDELGELARAFDRMRGRLAQLDDARRAFIANASHELRTPLFSLGGFLELLQDEDLDEQTRNEFVATMSEQVDRLTKLATDLLDLSRIDAGRLVVEPEPLDLALLAQALADEFRGIAQSSDHQLDVVADVETLANADPDRALQIGRILVENAFRHTPAGTRVRLRVRQPARLEVEDDGPGIPAEDAGRIFERFTRLETTSASGSGLGLAIARELADVMGGTIELESRPGRTVFALVLPAGEPALFSRENEPAAVA